MTINFWITESIKKLHLASVDSPRSDALILLESATNKDRAWIIAHPEHILSAANLDKLAALIKRRLQREPLAYILQQKEFYGRNFIVNPDVLIPRPESEDFIDLLKVTNPKKVFDIGTGSGCLAITANLELLNASVTAVDISETALQVARRNAKRHQINIKFLQGSLLEPLANIDLSPSSVIIANLPYVPKNLVTSPEITTEPTIALFAGKDGLDVYRKFWKEVKGLAEKPQYILIESLQTQHKELKEIAQQTGYRLQEIRNLIQLFTL